MPRLADLQITPLQGEDGQFSPDTLKAALHPRSRYQPPQTVVSVEQTANIGGGTIWKKTALDDVVKIAKANGIATDMDGARLLNATVATGISARDMAAGWDFAWIDFSKGLGAPIGGVIAGSRAFIDEVWRWKQRLGGSMRQAGVCAAACVYALDHNVDRLTEDHANARALARGLSQIAGIEVQQPETNLVFFKPDGAGVSGEKLVAALRPRGVLLATMDGRIRACTHLDVTAEMIEEMVGHVQRDRARGIALVAHQAKRETPQAHAGAVVRLKGVLLAAAAATSATSATTTAAATATACIEQRRIVTRIGVVLGNSRAGRVWPVGTAHVHVLRRIDNGAAAPQRERITVDLARLIGVGIGCHRGGSREGKQGHRRKFGLDRHAISPLMSWAKRKRPALAF